MPLIFRFQDEAGVWHGSLTEDVELWGDVRTGEVRFFPKPVEHGADSPFAGQVLKVEYANVGGEVEVPNVMYRVVKDDPRCRWTTYPTPEIHSLLEGYGDRSISERPSRPAAASNVLRAAAPPLSAELAEPAPRAPAEIDAAAIRRLWPEVLAEIEQRSKVTWHLMEKAVPLAVAGNELVLAVPHEGYVHRFAELGPATVVQESLFRILGVRWSLRAVVAKPVS